MAVRLRDPLLTACVRRETTPSLPSRRKRVSREVHRASEYAQKVRGMRAKQHNQKRFKEKIEMKKKCGVAGVGRPCDLS